MQSNVPICDYEGSPWRDAFWPGREYEDRAERIALAHLLPPRGRRLVEIGAGFGRLAELYRGYDRVILLDYARSMLEQARERVGADPRYMFVAADLYNLPFADSALDTAVTIRVLHHVANVPSAFGEIARVLRPQGIYVTDFANKRHLKAIAERLAGKRRADSPFSLAPYEFVKLNFDYHPRYISENLGRSSFSIQDRRAVSTFRIAGLKRLLPAGLLVQLDALIQRPTARLELAPSLFLRAESFKPGTPDINPVLWRCPRCCSASLDEGPNALTCRACHTVYPCHNGIYELKVPPAAGS